MEMRNSISLALWLGVGAALGLVLFDLVKIGGQMGWGAVAPGDALGITAGVAVGFLAGRRLGQSSFSGVFAHPRSWGFVGVASGLAFMAVMEIADAPNRIGLFDATPGLRGSWAELLLGGWTGCAVGFGIGKREPALVTSDMGDTPSAHSMSSPALGIGFGIGGGLGAFASTVLDGEYMPAPALLYALGMAGGMLLAFPVWKRVAQFVNERRLGRPRKWIWIWIGAAAGFAMCVAMWASWSLQFTMYDLFDSRWASFFIAAFALGLWNAFLLGCALATRFTK